LIRQMAVTCPLQCCSYPLCVTSVCRSPSLRNMSTTVSMGVWSVMVMGAMSKIFFSFSGGGPDAWGGTEFTNRTRDCPQIPSSVRFAFAAAHSHIHQTWTQKATQGMSSQEETVNVNTKQCVIIMQSLVMQTPLSPSIFNPKTHV
jgi:hypothetical protein